MKSMPGTGLQILRTTASVAGPHPALSLRERIKVRVQRLRFPVIGI